MLNKINCLTFNVNGLADNVKRREIFNYLIEKKSSLVLLQEVHSVKGCENFWSTQWGRKIYFSHGESNARGVAILLAKDFDCQVHNVVKDNAGRYLILYCTIHHQKVVICNIYAPNRDDPIFFEMVFTDLIRFTPDYFVIGGDLNLALDPLIDKYSGKSQATMDKAAEWLNSQISDLELTDVWRHFNADIPGYTWRRLRPDKVFSRLDYFLISDPALQLVNKIDIMPGFRSDHSIVRMTLSLDSFSRGPEYWKFNTSLLRDTDYIEKINKLLDIEIANRLPSIKDTWEQIKLVIKNSTIQYSVRKSKSDKNRLQVLERKEKRLEDELINKNPLFDDSHEQLLKVKKEIKEIRNKKTKGAILRSRVQWVNDGEKPTKYFLNLEKHNYKKKTLFRVADRNGMIVEDEHDILDQIKDFYSNLYKSRNYVDHDYLSNLVFPQLDPDIKQSLDSHITLSELNTAVKDMKNNKCPGLDGIPIDFYKIFWNKLRDLLYELYLNIIDTEALHLSARQSVISLLEKQGKNPLYLSSWRPLSLLNADNKILGKILANRLQSALPQLVHHSQTGFIKNRQLSENILKILKVIDVCNDEKINAFLVSFDFEKAFDHCEPLAIQEVLRKFGFGENFVKMNNIIFRDQIAYTCNNGYLSTSLKPTRGCRQGCTYSPSIFVLTVEALGIAIRNNADIEGIQLGLYNVKSGQFADDLWATLKNIESVNAILQELSKFYMFSGLKLNAEKTVIVKIGPHKDTDAKYFTLKKLFWSTGPIKILGIMIALNRECLLQSNFDNMLTKVESALFSWSHRNLTLMGKICVINSLVNTLFIHKFMALPSPNPSFFSKYRSLITKFIWNNTPAKISYNKLVQGYDKLGLKLCDLSTKDQALKAAWPVRWMDRETEDLGWLDYKSAIPLNHIWEANLSPRHVKKLFNFHGCDPLPCIVAAWNRFSFKDSCDVTELEDILHQPLCANSVFTIGDKPILSFAPADIGCAKVIDLIKIDDNLFYSYNELKNLYGHRIYNPLTYYAIIASFPITWKNIIRMQHIEYDIDPLTKVELISKSLLSPSKYIYWEILEQKYPPSLALKRVWEIELNRAITVDEWWHMYPNILTYIKSTKLRTFHYKVLNRALTTNVRRNKWDSAISPLCEFCNTCPETLSHLLVYCQHVEQIWVCFARFCKHLLDIEIELTEELILFNNYSGQHKSLINLLLMIVKQYIYATKCKAQELNFYTCVSKIADWYNVEKCIATKSNNVNNIRKFETKWAKMFEIV